MGQLFDALGIDIKILIAQFVNFAILLAILYKLTYKPILKFLNERTAKIEKGVEDAKKSEQSLREATTKSEKILVDARMETQHMIEEACVNAKKQGEELMEQQKEKLKEIAERAKKDISSEREQILNETKEEAVALVLQVTEKLLQEKVDEKTDKEFVEKMLAEIK